MLLAGGLLLVLAAACDDGPESLATPTSTALPGTPSPTPGTTRVEQHVPIQPGVLGQPIDLDATLLVAIYEGIGSGQPPARIERIRINQQGIVERITAFDASDFVSGAYINSWRNSAHPASGSGGDVVVALCHGGQCGGMDNADDQAKTTLTQTTDNGQTWETLTTLDGAYWVASWRADPAEILLFDYPTASEPAIPLRFVRWPSMQAVNPPATSSGTALERQWPVLLADGRVGWWWSDERLLDDTGAAVLDLPGAGEPSAQPIEILPSPDGERLAVTWATGGIQNQRWYWTLFERQASGRYEPERTVSRPVEISHAVPYSWLDDDRVIVPATVSGIALGLAADTHVGYVPAVLDFASGEIRPLAAFTAPDVVGRGNLVVGID